MPQSQLNDLFHPAKEQIRNPQKDPHCWDASMVGWSTWSTTGLGPMAQHQRVESRRDGAPYHRMLLEVLYREFGQPVAAGWAKQVGSPRDNVNSAGRRKFCPRASVQQGWRNKHQASSISWMPRNLTYVYNQWIHRWYSISRSLSDVVMILE